MAEYDLKKRYEIFLNSLSKELNRMFEEQKEFIMCKEGCSFCCEYGEYPFSKLEMDYLLDGYKELDDETKFKILDNIAKLNDEKMKSESEPYMYCCPFLINNRCSVYNNRGIICRTFGLLCDHDDGRLTMPFCHEKGLNYSKIYDKDKGQLVLEKDGVVLAQTEPKAYRVGRVHVQNLSIAKNLDIEWGESKTLLDYLNESDIASL